MLANIMILLAILAAGWILLPGVLTHVLTLNWTRQGEAIAKNVTLTADSEENLSASWAEGASDAEYGIEITVANVVSLYMNYIGEATGDQLVIDTNSSSEPDDTITLTHNKPLVWYEGCGWDLATVLTADVTALFLTDGAEVSVGSLEVRVLHNAAA